MSQILLITSSPRVDSYSTRVARNLAENLASRPGSGLRCVISPVSLCRTLTIALPSRATARQTN
jgi:hypothetical protein